MFQTTQTKQTKQQKKTSLNLLKKITFQHFKIKIEDTFLIFQTSVAYLKAKVQDLTHFTQSLLTSAGGISNPPVMMTSHIVSSGKHNQVRIVFGKTFRYLPFVTATARDTLTGISIPCTLVSTAHATCDVLLSSTKCLNPVEIICVLIETNTCL